MKMLMRSVGYILPILAIVVTFTVPEIRKIFGLDGSSKDGIGVSLPTNKIESSESELVVLPGIDVKIVDKESGQRDVKFESYFYEIVRSLKIEKIKIRGKKSVGITRNKTISSEVRAEIELEVNIDDKPFSIPIMYGRGDTKKTAVDHGLYFNKEAVANRMKELK